MSASGECYEEQQVGCGERVMGAFLDNGEQGGFFEEVALMSVLAQGSRAIQLLGTSCIL